MLEQVLYKIPRYGTPPPLNEVQLDIVGGDVATYPNGYGGTPAGTSDMRTIEGVETRTTVQRLHPEFWRRVRAMMEDAARVGVMLGVGTGWRVQPSGQPGFAAPGNSYHEGFMPDGVSRPDGVHDRNAMAADMVPPNGWDWMGANCGRYGLVDFSDVNSEPWHIQPIEIPRSRNFATRMPNLQVWPLPGSPTAPGDFTVTPADDLAIREIVREQTLANCRAQTATAVNKFQALLNANPGNAIYAAALNQEKARLVEYDQRIAMLKVLGEVDTLEESAAAIQAGLAKLTVAELTLALTPAVTSAVTAALENANVDVEIDYAAVAEQVADELKERLAG